MKRAKRFRLNRHLDSGTRYCDLVKIVVRSPEDKEQLLLASEYIHGLRQLDTGIVAVNLIAHLYQCPDLIEVLPEENK